MAYLLLPTVKVLTDDMLRMSTTKPDYNFPVSEGEQTGTETGFRQ